MKQLTIRKKAISPIIATLLLILIAIAAGVVVYAYVIGFVGSSTGGSTSKGVLSVDLASASSATGKVTVFVRNTGSIAETFNNGFYIAGQSLASTQLPLAAIVTSAVSSGTATVNIAKVASNQFSLTPSGTWTGSFTITFLGVLSSSFSSNAAQTLTIPSTGVTISSSTFTGSFTISGTQTNAAIAVVTTGSLTLGVSGYQGFDLTQTGLSLSAGSSYTVTVIASDGTTVTASVKSS